MPRICFVIMPFSKTTSCDEEQWTFIYNNVLKLAVENAGLDYVCQRSVATRGNIVGAIIRDLNDSYVVLADLTDRNVNVFYELGVRHALKDRTLLIAQKREDIPFDLQAYANHVYDWKTPEGIKSLSEKMKELLTEIDSKPGRTDNPVSDFLRVPKDSEKEVEPEPIVPSEVPIVQSLVGEASEGINVQKLVQDLEKRARPGDTKAILRLTRTILKSMLTSVVKELNERPIPQITTEKIYDTAMGYISAVEPLVKNIEEFGLASIQEVWAPGVRNILKYAGDMITISEKPRVQQTVKFAQGISSLMAWRILCLCGAKALDDDEIDLVKQIIKEPIEVEEALGRYSNRSLIERRDLFYPDTFLGYANYPMLYIDRLWESNPYIKSYFDTLDSYQLAIAKFFILLVLVAPPDEDKHPLYPGYRLLKQASGAMTSLTSRIFASNDYLQKIANIMDISSSDLKRDWTERVKIINGVASGSWNPLRHEVLFPVSFGGERIED